MEKTWFCWTFANRSFVRRGAENRLPLTLFCWDHAQEPQVRTTEFKLRKSDKGNWYEQRKRSTSSEIRRRYQIQNHILLYHLSSLKTSHKFTVVTVTYHWWAHWYVLVQSFILCNKHICCACLMSITTWFSSHLTKHAKLLLDIVENARNARKSCW